MRGRGAGGEPGLSRTGRDIALPDVYYWLFIGMPASGSSIIISGARQRKYGGIFHGAQWRAPFASLILQLPVLLDQSHAHDKSINLRAMRTPGERSRIRRDETVGAMYWNALNYELGTPLPLPGSGDRTQALSETNLQPQAEIAERKQFEAKLAERGLMLEATMAELEAQKFAPGSAFDRGDCRQPWQDHLRQRQVLRDQPVFPRGTAGTVCRGRFIILGFFVLCEVASFSIIRRHHE